jgi:hypothetical protein
MDDSLGQYGFDGSIFIKLDLFALLREDGTEQPIAPEKLFDVVTTRLKSHLAATER